jgi:hypothetical protein
MASKPLSLAALEGTVATQGQALLCMLCCPQSTSFPSQLYLFPDLVGVMGTQVQGCPERHRLWGFGTDWELSLYRPLIEENCLR